MFLKIEINKVLKFWTLFCIKTLYEFIHTNFFVINKLKIDVANDKKNLYYIDTDHLSDYASGEIVKMIMKKIQDHQIKQ